MGIINGGAANSSGSPGIVSQQGSANWAPNQATVPSTADGGLIAAARPTRQSITIQNLGTTIVWLGSQSTGLLATNGFQLPGTIGATVTIPTTAAVYGLAATGTATVAILETY